ncbi:hypothetical protein ALQ93_00733 [Pseudomonas syringae pv. pisi]|uniref:ParA family protein n=2 Tax=Pseudomonas syringae group TaxID=136849 RepID=A0A3M3CH23_PSESJ|nr:hypothetical protein ALQ93_00733 [Pseudomonas syringae pv. pisi]RML61617.1 hypothetical protein ALQ92_200289 [Pseudomonas syringae pv. pisi]RMM24238.1 hypothetical protein ALQ82_200249 [Pseudomonas syringae pv. pisi]RMO23216.1 hypothetical protein ALQ44_01169 [Pseudomonas syringae pv. pisi]RMU81214.1 hypothetical protein ALP21_200373 [Pseudomonas savastanoi pv. phaseolicola]
MYITSLLSTKGGVGKTTLAANIGGCLRTRSLWASSGTRFKDGWLRTYTPLARSVNRQAS